jgi:outer membrane protein
MKRLTIIVSILFCFMVVGSTCLYAQTLKLGVFDIQKIMQESKTINGYRQELSKGIEAKRKPLTDKENSVKALEEKLRKEKLSAVDRRTLEEKLANEVKELKRLREDIDIELQRMDRELTQKAFRDIGEVVKNIADKENYTIIFEKNAAGIVHLKDTVDITGKVLSQLK